MGIIENQIQSLREQIMKLPTTAGGKRRGISEALKQAIVEVQGNSGISVEQFAKEIGVSASILFKWRRKLKNWRSDSGGQQKKGFRKVSIEGVNKAVRLLSIEGPGGMRIHGLNIGEVAELWRALC